MSSTDCNDPLPAISPADLDTSGNEPRIHDLRLAGALGMADPHSIRRMIVRHMDALMEFGDVISDADRKTGRGRPSKKGAYYLTKKQALYITAKSDTERAALVTIQMVEVFDAVTSQSLLGGEAIIHPPQPQPAPSAPTVEQEALSILNFIEKAPSTPALAPPARTVQMTNGRALRILRFPEVRGRIGGYTRMHVDRLEKAGLFPKRVKLGGNSVGWIESEIEDWLAAKAERRGFLIEEDTPQMAIAPPDQPRRKRGRPPSTARPAPAPTPTPALDDPNPVNRCGAGSGMPLASDMLDGPEQIAAFVGMTTESLLAVSDRLPVFWIGGRMFARKSMLTMWFIDVERQAVDDLVWRQRDGGADPPEPR